MAAPVESIMKLDDALSGVPFDFAFLGGSVLSLLVTDKTADAIRVTKDVDVMVDVKNRREFHGAPELEDAIDGFVLTEPDPPKRKADILSRIQRVAALAQGMLE